MNYSFYKLLFLRRKNKKYWDEEIIIIKYKILGFVKIDSKTII
jgi:hypothetical protein